VPKFDRRFRGVQAASAAKYATPRLPEDATAPVEPVKDENSLQAQLAARLRAAYIRERRRWIRAVTGKDSKYGSKSMPRWDGGRDDDGACHKSVWLDIARHLLDMKCLSPERFVQAQFVEKQPPMPPMLKSEAAWKRFTDFNGDATARLKSEFKAECIAFELAQQEATTWFPEYDKKDVWRFVLRDTQSQLSALFRFCVALSEHLGDIAEQFQELALLDYLQDPQGYEQVWGTKIPDSLKEDAKDILSGLERKPPCQ